VGGCSAWPSKYSSNLRQGGDGGGLNSLPESSPERQEESGSL
jgi:hypothetical protein